MITPPHPGFDPKVPNVLRSLQWRPLQGDVGELSGGWLAMAGSGAAGVLWYAGEQQTPAGIAPRLVSKDAWTALREGQVGQDGVITWNGRGFRLADVCEGDQLVARLVAAT